MEQEQIKLYLGMNQCAAGNELYCSGMHTCMFVVIHNPLALLEGGKKHQFFGIHLACAGLLQQKGKLESFINWALPRLEYSKNKKLQAYLITNQVDEQAIKQVIEIITEGREDDIHAEHVHLNSSPNAIYVRIYSEEWRVCIEYASRLHVQLRKLTDNAEIQGIYDVRDHDSVLQTTTDYLNEDTGAFVFKKPNKVQRLAALGNGRFKS